MLTSPGFGPEIKQAQLSGWGQTPSKSSPPPMTLDTLQDIPFETNGVNIQGTQMGDNKFGVNLSLTPTSNYYSPLFGGTPVNVDTTVIGDGGAGNFGALISQFNARITAATSLGNGRWSYTVEEGETGSGSFATTGNTYSGVLNELELGNTSTLQSGYTISGGYIQLSSGVTALQIAAVPVGTCVVVSVMQDGNGLETTLFSQQNPFQGSLGGSPFLYAKITGSTHHATSTIAKWTYNYTQMTLDTSGNFVTTATTGTATNNYEEANTSTSHSGLPVNNNRLLDFAGYEVQPVPNDSIVQISVASYTASGGSTAYKYTFSTPNPVKNTTWPNTWFWAKITASSAISGSYGRWSYSFTEQTPDSSSTLTFTNGTNTGTAYNEWEAGNTAALQGGYTISGGYISGAPNYTVGSIPANTIVKMRVEQVPTSTPGTYNLRYVFNAPNPVVGECAP